MPKFMTYQRPAAVNKQSWQGRQPGVAYGKPARSGWTGGTKAPTGQNKEAPKPVPEARDPVLDIQLPLPRPPKR